MTPLDIECDSTTEPYSTANQMPLQPSLTALRARCHCNEPAVFEMRQHDAVFSVQQHDVTKLSSTMSQRKRRRATALYSGSQLCILQMLKIPPAPL
jgi:hypothetical protein